MKAFASLISKISQKPVKKDFANYDTLISFGYFWEDMPSCRQLFALHPLFMPENKSIQCLRYEVGTEFGIAWLLAYSLSPLLNTTNTFTQELKTKLQLIDVGYLSSETNLAEEELESIMKYLNTLKKPLALILGKELALHPHAQDIALICGILGASDKIIIIMPEYEDSQDYATPQHISLELCEDLPESNGNFVYIMPSSVTLNTLKIPPLFAPTLKLKDKQHITLNFESQHIEAICERDDTKKGTIALLYLSKIGDMGYPYKKVEVII